MRNSTKTTYLLVASTLFVVALIAIGCAEVPTDGLDVNYETWETTTERELTGTIPGHSSSGRRKIYINETGTMVSYDSSSDPARWEYPPGTIIVKEIYPIVDPGPDDQPTLLLGMIKNPEDPTARAGWVWLLRRVATGEEQVFDNEYCVTCHSDANELRRSDAVFQIGEANDNREFRDFVFYPYQAQIK